MLHGDRRRGVVSASVVSAALVFGAAGYAVAELRATSADDSRNRVVQVVPVLGLPEPRLDGETSLEAALLARRSTRRFADEALSLGQLGQLLWAAQGEGSDGRNAPSAGALYPLELYVAHERGVYHYRPSGHEVVATSDVDIRDALATAALDQRAFHTAPVVILVAGVTERTAVKYGSRADRYVWIEAGHAGQNVLLQAAALSLGAVPTGAFRDEHVAELFDLPDGTAPLYLIPVGEPR